MPDASALQFVFRAITPPGRPRRFDARFFLADAAALASDPDDFSAACDELSHLQWIPLEKVRHFDMPFITEVVLAEVAARARDASPPASVPFFFLTGAAWPLDQMPRIVAAIAWLIPSTAGLQTLVVGPVSSHICSARLCRWNLKRYAWTPQAPCS